MRKGVLFRILSRGLISDYFNFIFGAQVMMHIGWLALHSQQLSLLSMSQTNWTLVVVSGLLYWCCGASRGEGFSFVRPDLSTVVCPHVSVCLSRASHLNRGNSVNVTACPPKHLFCPEFASLDPASGQKTKQITALSHLT